MEILFNNGSNTSHSMCEHTQEFIEAMKYTASISSILSILGALLVIIRLSMKPSKKKNGGQPQLTSTETQTAYGGTNDHSINHADTNDVDNRRDNTDAEMPRQETPRRCCTNMRIIQQPAVFILISISVADIMVASSHLWGVLSSYEYALSHDKSATRYDYAECGAQAAITVFGTISSLLWSDILVFVACVMLLPCISKDTVDRMVSGPAFVVYSIIGWGIPFLMVLILGGGLDAFGFGDGVGWCYMNLDNGHQAKDIWIGLFSYDLWADFSILFIICIAGLCGGVFLTYCITKSIGKLGGYSEGNWLILKMVIAALLVVFLRIWSLIIDTHLYWPKNSPEKQKLLCSPWLQIFSGIGTSSQGIMNAFVFVIFPQIYKRCCKRCCGKMKNATELPTTGVHSSYAKME